MDSAPRSPLGRGSGDDPARRESLEHLFRHESGRMTAALTRVFGVHNLPLAEDVVQDALCRALEVWKLRGMPENPAAWLMTTAKNRAVDVLRRERRARSFAPELERLLESEWTFTPTIEEAFGPYAIRDDELRMMFSCVDPRLAEESQVALILHILCGFSVGEIGNAFLSSAAAIEKRITRGKSVLSTSQRLFELSASEDFRARLAAIQRALYLLFNEGYHGSCAETVVRVELCREAMRLATLLCEHALAAIPSTRALLALMCLHAARLPTRVDESGSLNLLTDQDRSQWNAELIARGQTLLEQSATGEELSEYHVEAAIAWCHATAPSAQETDWRQIVSHYDTLMSIRPSPVIALNRAIAVAQHEGPEHGLAALRELPDRERLARYPFYPIALGEFELQCGRRAAAREHFTAALPLARNAAEQRFIEQRIDACADRVR
ncbi:MAG: sigma factor, ECF subfamily protein [Gammaproteobacteria bacterium]|nr:sigma factor, ECF subfamily protein [Gammaproteobacteria bacterium]